MTVNSITGCALQATALVTACMVVQAVVKKIITN